MDAQQNESVLRNLAEELLTEEECQHFKQALHHFRVSNSVTTLCQQLKPVINNTSKILLLVELNNRMPKALQDDFHRLCSLQFPNYDTYLKIFTNGNVSRSGSTRVIGQDSTGKLKVFNRSLEKKSSKYSNSKQTYELRSQPGTSVTSGVYSYASDDNESDDVFTEEKEDQNKGQATPVFVDGKNNVHKVFLDRHDDGSLGLGITGGKEYGSEIEINVVEDGGPAAKMGLKVGDKILEVNGHNFHNITHAEAVMIMRNAWNLIVLVERPTKQENGDLGNMMGKQHQIKTLDILVFPSTSGKLGCVSQRLPNQDLIVMSVEENSPAFKSGMRNFDLIYKIDGISVRGLSESQIVMLLNAKRISLSIKRYVPIPLQNGDITDAATRAKSSPPTKHQQQLTSTYRSVSSPRSTRQRNKSSESRQNFQNVVYYSSDRNNHSANNAYMTLKGNAKPEHLVYGNRSVREPNWIISPKPREHRYTQRREVLRESTSNTYPNHVRSRSADPFQTHYVSASKEAVMSQGRASRYIRKRSKSPHRSTISRVHNEDNVIRAVQMGLEKRNRAVRQSLYQMADPADYEWEIY